MPSSSRRSGRFAERAKELLILALFVASSLSSSCRREGKSPYKGKKELVCGDFADQAAGAYQNRILTEAVTDKKSTAPDERVRKLRARLYTRCMKDIIPSAGVSCVLSLSPKTYARVRKCLSGQDMPVGTGRPEDDEDGLDVD